MIKIDPEQIPPPPDIPVRRSHYPTIGNPLNTTKIVVTALYVSLHRQAQRANALQYDNDIWITIETRFGLEDLQKYSSTVVQ